MSSFPNAVPHTSAADRRMTNALGLLVLVLVSVAIAFGAVQMPWVVTGAVVGVLVVIVALTAPLALVATMLAVGAIDLSFMTGGFKALLPELGGLDMNGIRLVGATAGFVAYLAFEPRARAAAFGPLGRIWVLFLLFAGASLATSLNPLEGLRLLLKIAYPLLTFLVVIGLAQTRDRVELLMKYTLIAAAVITMLVNPLLVLDEGSYRVDAGMKRFGGLGLGDNPFAFYLTAILLMSFTRFLLRQQVRYLVLCVVAVIWIGLTMTRIAAAASIVGLGVIGLLAAITSGQKKLLIVSTVAAAVATAVLIPQTLMRTFGFVPTIGEFFDIARNPVVLYKSINWQGRELLWAILWGAFMSSPLVGLGMGSSTSVIRETFPNQSVQVAHNEYMRLATDTGLIGIGLFAAAAFAWLIAAVRMSLRGTAAVREYAFPAVAALFAWGIIAITDNAFDYYTVFTQYVGFLVAGAVVIHTEAKG